MLYGFNIFSKLNNKLEKLSKTTLILNPLKEYFTDITGSASFKNCDLIDHISVKAQIDQVINDPKATFAMGERAFTDLYPYLWEQHFLKRA